MAMMMLMLFALIPPGAAAGHSIVGEQLHPTPGVKSLLSLQREQGSLDLHSSTYNYCYSYS